MAIYSPESGIGVGSIVCAIDGPDTDLHESSGLFLTDLDGRVCFPAWTEPFVGRALGLMVGSTELRKELKVYFLFTEDAPVRLQVRGSQTYTHTVTVDLRGFDRHIKGWWQAYQAQAQTRNDHDGFACLDTFMTYSLGRQLGLTINRQHAKTGWTPSMALELLTGANGLRKHALKEVVLGVEPETKAELPLPSGIPWVAESVPRSLASTAIEPIAHYVPDDCVYVRFGAFSTYLWLNETGKARARDFLSLTAPITSKGRHGQMIQQQLAVGEVPFAQMFGDQIIEDIAIIAKDLFFDDGAAFGVVFRSNSQLVATAMAQSRKSFRKKHHDRNATLKEIDIAGQTVTLLATPDNRIRSFHVQKDDFHLLTNCRAIAESFVRIEKGKGSLASDLEFQYSRQRLFDEKDEESQARSSADAPGSKTDGEVFAYIPRKCLENITAPAYQIELWRRTRSVAQMQALEMAIRLSEYQRRIGWPLADAGDGMGEEDHSDQIVGEDVLPSTYQKLAGGGRLVASKTGVYDTVRGRRGSFLPIPDTDVTTATATEIHRYQEFADYLGRRTRTLPPIALSLRRTTLNDGNAKLGFRMQIAPFDRTKYDFLRFFTGEASPEFLAPGPDTIGSLSILIRDFTGRGGIRDDFTVAAMVNETVDEEMVSRSLFRGLGKWKSYPLYCVSTLSLDRFPVIGAIADDTARVENGLQRLPLGLYRKAGLDLTAISFQPELLRSLPTDFHMRRAATPAHIRLHVGDVAKSKMAPAIRMSVAEKERKRSIQNASFLNELSQQLSSPPGDSWEIASNILGGPLRCPMGGHYQLSDDRSRWVSSRWSEPPTSPDAHPLAWLASVEVNVAFGARRVVAVGDIQLKNDKQVEDGKSSILDLFRSKKET